MNNEKQSGFKPLEELQRIAKQQNGGKQPHLQQRPRLVCPPKPDDYDNSSFYGDKKIKTEQTTTTNSQNNLKKDQNDSTIKVSKMPQSHIYSKYEIKEDTCFYIRFGITWQDDRLIVTYQDKLNPNIESHWLKFRMWSFEECNKIKNKCYELDIYKNYIYNKVKLFKQQMKYLLVDWSFGIKDPNMRLMHVNKILSDESINLIMNMHPNILFYIQDNLKNILQGNK